MDTVDLTDVDGVISDSEDLVLLSSVGDSISEDLVLLPSSGD